MITLTYAQLNNPNFADTVSRLAQKEGFSNAKVSFNVSRIYRQISAKLKQARVEFSEFSEPFTLKDETGLPVKADGPAPFPFKIIPEKQAEFEAQTVVFFNQECSIESYPLSLEDLGSVEISPLDILNLGNIIVEESSESSLAPKSDALAIVPEQSPSH